MTSLTRDTRAQTSLKLLVVLGLINVLVLFYHCFYFIFIFIIVVHLWVVEYNSRLDLTFNTLNFVFEECVLLILDLLC